MNYFAIISAAAQKAGVASSLLFAMCSYESSNFTKIHVQYDGGSPSHGICMVKEGTARFMGYKGSVKELENNPSVNAYYAGLYLKYQSDFYKTDDWCILASAYNAGSYNESEKFPGFPRNLKYVRRVQNNLEPALKPKMSCGARK